MTTHRLPPLYRHAWSAFTVSLAAATLRPSEQGILLTVAILCALPWSLALLLLELSQGFADRAALIVTRGLFANAAFIWWLTAVLRARFLRRQSDELREA
jgi:hypothetical protein